MVPRDASRCLSLQVSQPDPFLGPLFILLPRGATLDLETTSHLFRILKIQLRRDKMAGLLTPPHMVGPPIVWHPNNTIMPEEYRGSDPAGYAFNYWLRHNCKGFNWLDDYLEIYQGKQYLQSSHFTTP
jgi:hypothetical protein